MIVLVFFVAAALITAGAFFGPRGAGRPARLEIAVGAVLTVISFAVPLVLNHALDSDFLHRLHKFLAFGAALAVFGAWAVLVRSRHAGSAGPHA